jgi:TolB-like protein
MKAVKLSMLVLLLVPSFGLSQEHKNITLSVMDLTPKSGISIQEAEQLTERLVTELYKTDAYTIMERSKRDEILREQGFAQSGACNEDACITEAGQLLSVTKIIGGSVGKFGNTWSLNIRLIDVKTGVVEKALGNDFKGDMDNLLKAVKAIAAELVPNVLNEAGSDKKEPGSIGAVAIAEGSKAKLPSVDRQRRKKSVKKAFLLSLLLPGAGEHYVGHKYYARGFLSAEGAVWSFALFSKIQGEIWRSDYVAYSAQEAGSNPGRSDDNYYQNIYEWSNSSWYNEDQWRQARELYPYDPAAQAAYVEGKLYSEEDSWAWADEAEWNHYRNLRVKSRSALHRISYSMGAAVLNRMLSSVNAARLAKRYNKNRLKTSSVWNWQLQCGSYAPSTLSLVLHSSF